nr:plasma protease C1 inhibitor isoform X1 [Pogona vitticeps]
MRSKASPLPSSMLHSLKPSLDKVCHNSYYCWARSIQRRLIATMKTWLILLCLATTGIPSFSWEVADGKLRVAGTPSLPQDPGRTNANTKDEAGIWNFFKRAWGEFLDFVKGEEDDQTRVAGTPLPFEGTRRMERSHSDPDTWKLHKPKLHFSMRTSDKENEVDDESINPKQEATPLSDTSNEIKGEAATPAYTQNTDDEYFFELPKCVNATEMAVRAPTTAEPVTTPTTAVPTTCPPQKCPPLRINPWAACTNSTPEDNTKLAEALTEFTVRFYKTATRHKSRDSNFVFSPLSISTMLSNLLLGTCDETKDRLEKLLSYPKEFTCVHKALKAFSKSEALTSANAIFYQPALKLESDFRNLSKAYYQTELLPLTNNSNQAVFDINAWVNRHTGGKIKKLLDDLDSDAQMVLLNAVYFHSKWKNVFKLENTKREYFYRANLPRIKVPMMMSKKYPVASYMDHYLGAKVGRFQMSHGMSLVIIVPRALSQNLSEVEDKLSGPVFQSMMAKLETIPFKPTIVSLPKFKVDSSQDLMEIIGAMDYGFFFDANLCGISREEEVAVSGAQHRAVIQISEEGVEAAAATQVSLARSANFFEVQQPFLFSLWKDKTAPLFLGRISDPQSQ